MEKNNKLTLILSVLSMALLSACGGGEGGNSSSNSNTSGGTQPTTNSAPVVSVSDSFSSQELSTLTIAADASDSDGSISSYSWTQTSGTPVELNNTDNDEVSITIPEVSQDETITLEVVVTDNEGASTTKSVSILISDIEEVGETYTIKTIEGEVTFTGVIDRLELIKKDYIHGYISDFNDSPFLALYVKGKDEPYYLTLDGLDSVSSSDESILKVEVINNVFRANKLGKAEITISVLNIEIITEIEVKRQSEIWWGHYPITTENGTEIVEGTPSALTLNLATTTIGDIYKAPSEDLLALYFEEYETPYYITLDTLDDITSSNDKVISVNQGNNTISVVGEGTATISLYYKGLELLLEYTVTRNEVAESGISGHLSYQRFGFTDGQSARFDVTNPYYRPIRGIVVELLDSEQVVLASTVSDESGNYTFPLSNESNGMSFSLRLTAQLEPDGEINDGFNIVVKDQSTAESLAEQQVYTYASEMVTYGDEKIYFDLYLDAGWDDVTKAFDGAISDAQPFAILDTVYSAVNYLATAGIELKDELAPLTINWTRADVEIEREGGFYSRHENRIYLRGDLRNPAESSAQSSSDPLAFSKIEEWDQTTIAHEFGHFYQHKVIGRDDSTGGSHRSFDHDHLPLAFSEGFAQAFAYAVLDDWRDMRAPSNVLAEEFWSGLYGDITSAHTCTTTLADGTTYTLDCYFVSPFEEATNTLFILSLIDGNKDSTKWSTNLADQFGMAKLHQAMKLMKEDSATMSIYSLAETAKQVEESLISDIDELGEKLDTVFVDQWGSEQGEVASHIVYGTDGVATPLNTESYLPVHIEASDNAQENVCFNSALQSMSNPKVGTMRFLKYTPTQDGMVTVKTPSVTNIAGNEVTFNISAKLKGETAENHLLFPNGNLDEAEFMARAGEEYVIDITGKELFYGDFKFDELLCTDVTITQQ